MRLSKRQFRTLQAMGIPVWQARSPEGIPESLEPVPDQVIETPVLELRAEVPDATAEQAPMTPEKDFPDTSAATWQTLQAMVRDCQLCELAEQRTQTVFGVGNQEADLMLIGEAPGAEEDRQGEPFVGRAGQLLNRMLKAIGLERSQVYIANIVKCRPPGNRDPRPEEAQACAGYLKRQIELVRPKVILVLGRVAAHNLLQTDEPLGRLRGAPHIYSDTGIPAIVTYHPAYLLRTPIDKRKSWEDLKLAATLVAGKQ